MELVHDPFTAYLSLQKEVIKEALEQIINDLDETDDDFESVSICLNCGTVVWEFQNKTNKFKQENWCECEKYTITESNNKSEITNAKKIIDILDELKLY